MNIPKKFNEIVYVFRFVFDDETGELKGCFEEKSEEKSEENPEKKPEKNPEKKSEEKPDFSPEAP